MSKEKARDRIKVYPSLEKNYRDKALLYPVLAIMILFAIYPTLHLVYTSLHYYVYTMPASRRFSGLENFINIFQDPDFLKTIFNTVFILGTSLVIQMALGVALGFVFAKNNFLTKVGRILLILPMATSPIVVSQVWNLLYDAAGPVNYYLTKLGLDPVLWMSGTWSARFAVIIADCWEWTPFVILIVCTAVMGVSKEYSEAARIDGATKLQETWHVLLPIIKPTITVAFLFRLIDLFRNFDLVFGLTYGGPSYATETLGMAIYRDGFLRYYMGRSAAISIVMMILAGIIGSRLSKVLLKDNDK